MEKNTTPDDYRSLLFFHINSYWIYKYLKAYSGLNGKTAVFNQALLDKISSYGERTDYVEGYELGEFIFRNYSLTEGGKVSLGGFAGNIEGRLPGYLRYLEDRIYAWGVPLSYHDYDRVLHGAGDHPRFDKRLNLWGSTAAHSSYFRKLVPEIKRHLETMPAERRPVGIVDVGCGDGALLRDIRSAIKDFPQHFTYIGIDIDPMSNQIAAENENEDIVYLQGDVSDPDEINRHLISLGYPSLDSYFHVRAFVDHNFNPALASGDAEPAADSTSTYVYKKGNQLISSEKLLEAYKSHFTAWKKYIARHGIGLIELHRTDTLSLYESPAAAYEIFHFLSGQYVIRYSEFAGLVQAAGWEEKQSVYKVPASEPSVSISIYQ